MKYVEPPPAKENPNVSKVHPLKDFLWVLSLTTTSLVALYFVVLLGADFLVTRLDPGWEPKIARKLSWVSVEPASETAPPPKSRPLEDLLKALQNTTGALRLPLTISVLQHETPNAFIVPGGHIYVTSGLLKTVKSENELAFVMAHEMGHFFHRDPLRALSRSLLFGILLSFVGIGLDSSNTLSPLSLVNRLAELSYSRTQEEKADRYGMELVAKHYGHTAGSLDFFEKIRSQGGEIISSEKAKKVLSYLNTHPLTDDRIRKLKEFIKEKNFKTNGRLLPLPSF